MLKLAIPYILAFVIMVVVMAAFPFFVSIKPIFPSDALVVNSHGHNAEVQRALEAANLPYLSIAGGASAHTPTFASFLWAYTRHFAVAFAIFFVLLFLMQRLLRAT